jgi:hypothetical protein
MVAVEVRSVAAQRFSLIRSPDALSSLEIRASSRFSKYFVVQEPLVSPLSLWKTAQSLNAIVG